MDTTLMEYTAEDLIAHKLQRSGILVAKPKFDQEGADLLALLGVSATAPNSVGFNVKADRWLAPPTLA